MNPLDPQKMGKKRNEFTQFLAEKGNIKGLLNLYGVKVKKNSDKLQLDEKTNSTE